MLSLMFPSGRDLIHEISCRHSDPSALQRSSLVLLESECRKVLRDVHWRRHARRIPICSGLVAKSANFAYALLPS